MNLPTEAKSIALPKNHLVRQDKIISSSYQTSDTGINALVDSSAMAFEYIHKITQHHTSSEIAASITQFLETLQKHYQQLGYSQDISIAAHYAICATLDDILRQHTKHFLHTTMQHANDIHFLQNFHQSHLESEKFYSILEHISTQPEKYIDLLELMYLCLRFGYKGQYRHTPFGLQQWTLLTDNLYRLITATRDLHNYKLSPNLTETPPATVPATSIITKRRHRFYGLVLLIFIAALLTTSFIFRQTYQVSSQAFVAATSTTSSEAIL